MREKIVRLYKYAELSDRAKATARDWYREVVSTDYDADNVKEDAARIGDLMGFDMRCQQVQLKNGTREWRVSVYFSGFWSQGDGACFDASWRADKVQPGKVAEECPQDAELHGIASEFERIALAYPDATMSIKHTGRYYHENSVNYSIEMNPPEDSDDIGRTAKEWETIRERDDALADELKEASRRFMQWIYSQLRADFEYVTSDEQLVEGIEANEYEFTIDGEQDY